MGFNSGFKGLMPFGYFMYVPPGLTLKKNCLLPTGCMSVVCMALGTCSCHSAAEHWLAVFLYIYKRRSEFTARYEPKYNAGQFLCRKEWHWGRFSSEYICFPMSVSFHQCSQLIFMCTVILPEGQTGKAWEPSKKQSSFENRGAWTRRMSSFLSAVKDLPPLTGFSS